MHIKDPALKRQFDEFHERPLDLILYIENAYEKHKCVVGTFLIQLATMSGCTLSRNGVVYTSLPESFVSPRAFDSIEVFLNSARMTLSAQGRLRRRLR